MAELVQRNVELLLPIFDQLEKDTVFEPQELRQIVKIVQEHEYNLQRADKDKELFIAYIQYMQTLLLLIEKRYSKNGQRTNPDVRHQMTIKLKLLFRKAIYRHQGDLSLWFSFINFAKRRSMQPLIGKLYNRMLQIHSDKPQIWISAAKWAFESNTITAARTYFQRGFRSNPKSRELFIEYFRFELLYIELIAKRKDVLLKTDETSDIADRSMFDFLPDSHLEDDKILSGEVPKAIFRNALNDCDHDTSLVNQFFQILEDFSECAFYRPIKTFLLDYLKEHYSDRESTWLLLACSNESQGNANKRIKSSHESTSFDKSCEIFADALEKLPTQQMWEYYLTFLLRQAVQESRDKKVYSKSLELFVNESNKCWSLDLFSKTLFLSQFDYFEKADLSTCEVRTGINLGLKKWEHDVEVWHRYIKYVMKMEHDSEAKVVIKTLFAKALNRLLLVQLDSSTLRNQFDQNFTQFVHLYINWIKSNLSEKECSQIFEKNSVVNTSAKDLRLARKLAAICKSNMLTSLAQFGDHERVRRTYEKFHAMNPITQDFFTQMLDLELAQPDANVDVQFARRVFNQMIAHFGQNDHQLWLRFARFEMKHGSHVKAADVYHMAKLQLNPKQSNLFVQEYQMIHA